MEDKYLIFNKNNEDYLIDKDSEYYDRQVLTYELTFNLISTINTKIENLTEKNKIFNILLKILENIINNPHIEKFRKLKLSNPNIQTIINVEGFYNFLIFLGFSEAFMDNDLYLYLSEYDIEILNIVYSYINILIVNEDKNETNLDQNSLPTLSELNENYFNQQVNEERKTSFIDILKQARSNFVNKNSIIENKWDNYKKNANTSNKKDIRSILKETSQVRNNNSDYFYNEYNVKRNNNFNYSIKQNNDNNKFKTLSDITYSNPNPNSNNVIEEIGKKCLILSNEFRKKNGLPPLIWDDHIWRISFEHSTNMGNKKVAFGHDGFNNRIRKLPYSYMQANENVFMCSGVSEYNVAEMGVNGWINSPGHRKNLLSNTNYCAIATYRNSYGEYYLTQIFIRK